MKNHNVITFQWHAKMYPCGDIRKFLECTCQLYHSTNTCETMKVNGPKSAESVCHLMTYCQHKFNLYMWFCDLVLSLLCHHHHGQQIWPTCLHQILLGVWQICYWHPQNACLFGLLANILYEKHRFFEWHMHFKAGQASIQADEYSPAKEQKMWKKIYEHIHQNHWTSVLLHDWNQLGYLSGDHHRKFGQASLCCEVCPLALNNGISLHASSFMRCLTMTHLFHLESSQTMT